MTSSPHPRGFAFTAARAATAAAAAALLVLAGCATAPPAAPVVELDFPSPASGPGRPVLEKAAKRHIEDGWQALRRGDTAAARSAAAQAGTNSASKLLELQSEMVGGDPPLLALEELAGADPGYAAAWLTLSVAAEREDDEALALRAAESGASLWSDTRWTERSQTLRRTWIDDRIQTARNLLEQDEPEASLDALEPALQLDPQNRDGVLLQARVLIEMDRLDSAEAILSGLPRDREVVLLAGALAESRGDSNAAIRIYSSLGDDPEAVRMAIALAEQEERWQTAMNLWSSLPDSQLEKARGLSIAKLRWRVSVMPEYVRESLTSDEMNRSDLAVAIVALAPKVETLPSKQVPLLSDIVDMPSQREIVTAAKLGLIDIDRMERRFHPLRPATATEVQTAISRLGGLLQIPEPEWCVEGSENPCVAFTQPIAGDRVAEVIIDMVAGEAS